MSAADRPLARRTFLQLLGAAGALSVFGACGETQRISQDERARRAARRATELVNADAAAALGARYFDQLEARTSDAISERLEPIVALLDSDGSELALEAAIETDFRGDRVIGLHGWTLSESEANLCLLLHLVEPS